MLVDPKIQRIYREIQRQLFYMIPEKWSKVYLYSSIIERANNLKMGELYFYYIPKGVLRKNPVNVYEVPAKFSISENEYLRLVDQLYGEIKRLQRVTNELGEEKWNSIVISIADFKFDVEYQYEDLIHFNFNSYEKHIIFRYKYLKYPFNSFSKSEKEVLLRYTNQEKRTSINVKEYSETMYEMPFETIEPGSKDSGIQYVKEDDERLIDENRKIKSQILKSGF